MTSYLMFVAEAATQRVLARNEYATKAMVLDELLAVPRISRWRERLRRIGPDLEGDRMLNKYLKGRIAAVLNRRDGNEIRVYESYKVGREYRWRPLRSMGMDELRIVQEDSSSFARKLEVKASAISILIEEMERAGAATVDEIYEVALPRILEMRSNAA